MVGLCQNCLFNFLIYAGDSVNLYVNVVALFARSNRFEEIYQVKHVFFKEPHIFHSHGNTNCARFQLCRIELLNPSQQKLFYIVK